MHKPGLLLEESPRLLGLVAAVGSRATGGHRARRRTRFPAAVAGAAGRGDVPVAEGDEENILLRFSGIHIKVVVNLPGSISITNKYEQI